MINNDNICALSWATIQIKAVIAWYTDEYGDLSSKAGPGKDVKLVLE